LPPRPGGGEVRSCDTHTCTTLAISNSCYGWLISHFLRQGCALLFGDFLLLGPVVGIDESQYSSTVVLRVGLLPGVSLVTRNRTLKLAEPIQRYQMPARASRFASLGISGLLQSPTVVTRYPKEQYFHVTLRGGMKKIQYSMAAHKIFTQAIVV
jgi:hypothetical protein